MNVFASAAGSFCLGAIGMGVVVPPSAETPPVPIDCVGCVATTGVRTATWRSDGQGGFIWDFGAAGSISYTNPASNKSDGACEPDGNDSVEDTEEECIAETELDITGGGGLQRFSHGASGCKKFGDLTDDELAMSAKDTSCESSSVVDEGETQDIFRGYVTTNCDPGPNINDEKLIVFAMCSQCKVE